MTKKDYILIAQAINRVKNDITIDCSTKRITPKQANDRQQAMSHTVISFMDLLEKENPNFNRDRFVEACNK